jgi:integrase
VRGTVKQRSEGSKWTAYWWAKDPGSGQWRQFTKGGFRTKGEAQRHLNGVLGRVAEGSYSPDKPVTVAQLFELHWLPAQRARGLRASTLSQYELAATSYIVPAVGATKVAALTPALVSSLVEKMATAKSANGRAGLSSRTRQVAVSVLKAATKWALANGMLSRDPLAGYQRPRLQRSAVVCWSPEQARQFLGYVKGDRLEAVWALALLRGLRRGELAGLRWSEVDLARGELRVLRARLSVDGRAIESDVKTASGRRTVPLDGRLVALLKAHDRVQKTERLRAGDAWQGEGHLITNELGEPYHPDALSKRFKLLVGRAGLPETHFHTLRHSCASLLLADGVNAKVIQELLGHSSVQITLSLYSHVAPSMGRDAGAALSASLLGDS